MPGRPPKQFCALLSSEPLLIETRRRVQLLISPEHTLAVVTQSHQRFYHPLLADIPTRSIVVQPANRETATAILYGLTRLRKRFDDGIVTIFPSDHHVDSAQAFMNHVLAASNAIETCKDKVVILGAPATGPETAYGWIEPGGHVGLSPLRRVRTFCEKPTPEKAQTLWQAGCLWNTFVSIGRLSTLLSLMSSALPDLCEAFRSIDDCFGTSDEDESVELLYGRIDRTDFSKQALAPNPESLAVYALTGVEWSDIGEIERLRRVVRE